MEKIKSNKLAFIIVAIVLCMVLLASVTVFIINSFSGPIVSVDNKSALVGNNVDFNINIRNNNGLYVGQLEIEYDPNVLEFISSGNGEVFDECNVNVFDSDNGKIIVILNQFGLENTKADGKLATITFKVKEDTKKGSYAIKLTPTKSPDVVEDVKSGTYFLRVQDIDQELFTIPKLKDGSIKVK